MASKKKHSEGIALLSLYNDEDDEMDDVEEEHDDGEDAASPEHEEGEVGNSGHAMFGSELQTANGSVQEATPSAQATPQTSEHPEPSQPDMMNSAMELEPNGAQEAADVSEEQKPVDPLDSFLPPPPKEKCPVELQEKINRFLNLRKAGRSFNTEVRKRKDYRNPDFLLHAVRYQDIDQIGSCFSTDVFNPHGYDPSDYYDEIEADMKREMERKEQERKKSQKVEFVSGGNQPATVAAPKINIPLPGVPSTAIGGLSSASTAVDTATRDGRQNKKSKWDKVDTGPVNPLTSGSQDSISKVGAHAALLSAANAGAGYMAFAQQRRREAEEKRSSEKKDRRT